MQIIITYPDYFQALEFCKYLDELFDYDLDMDICDNTLYINC